MDKEQLKGIKKQVLEQIEESDIPNKKEIKSSIESMNEEQLEEFLKQNKLIGDGSEKCIFCSIANKEVPSNIIDEDEYALAVLEINPISKGHLLIIPKVHSEEISLKVNQLAKKVAEKLKVFKPKKIDIFPTKLFGHEILNMLPVYKDETMNSKRNKAESKELEKIQEELIKVKIQVQEPEKEKLQKKEIISDKTHWLPKRIP